MHFKVATLAFELLRNEKTRNIIIGTTFSVFILIFVPIMYFFTNNPLALGIQEEKKNYENIQPIKANISQQEFINMVVPGAIEGYKKYKIFPSITIAQAILESAWGRSGLSRRANNLFGIKAFNWTGQTITMNTGEYYGGVYVMVSATFRAYSTPAESVKDHARFLTLNSRYRHNGVFSATTYVQQAEALRRAGYATDPNYPASLIGLIRKYNLQQYDNK